jgi:hypothetical protein
MNRFRKIMLGTGLIASGTMCFIHTTAIIFCDLLFANAINTHSIYAGAEEIAAFTAAFVFFNTAYSIYIIKMLRSQINLLLEIRNPHIRFIIDTAAETVLLLIIIVTAQLAIHPVLKATVIFSLAFILSFFFLSAAGIIPNLFLVRILFERTGFLPAITNGNTITLETLYLSAERLYNHCDRFNISLSFIGVRMDFPSLPTGERDFVIRKIGMELVENARNYEPWAIIPESAFFLCVIQTRDSFDLDSAVYRYEAVINKTVSAFAGGSNPAIRFESETFTAASFAIHRNEPSGTVIRSAFDSIVSKLRTADAPLKKRKDR